MPSPVFCNYISSLRLSDSWKHLNIYLSCPFGILYISVRSPFILLNSKTLWHLPSTVDRFQCTNIRNGIFHDYDIVQSLSRPFLIFLQALSLSLTPGNKFNILAFDFILLPAPAPNQTPFNLYTHQNTSWVMIPTTLPSPLWGLCTIQYIFTSQLVDVHLTISVT